MPELPEVEVVRRGLERHVVGRRIAQAGLPGHRVARRHLAGSQDLVDRLAGARVTGAHRRGKYLWLALDRSGGDGEALLLHLGMSGQLLVQPADVPDHPHVRAVLRFTDGDPLLRFVDQRTFGAMVLDPLDERGIPRSIAHIAADPLEPGWDRRAVVTRLRRRDSAIKRALLDQTLVSGIGNIYADESLWRARVHGERRASAIPPGTVDRLLGHVVDVMGEALAQGGTSFDRLYVNVNGASGYFDRSLAVYGRTGMPCRVCGAPIRREPFTNRSSFSCPRCQPRPRSPRNPRPAGNDRTSRPGVGIEH